MKRRRAITRKLRIKKRKPSPYKRLEQELSNCRVALGEASWQYVKVLQALVDLLAIYDRRDVGQWTWAETSQLARIRALAEGKEVNCSA